MHSLCYSDDAVTSEVLQGLRNMDLNKLETVIFSKKGIHAEINIVDKIKNTSQPISYIGISKLCCNNCITQIMKHNNPQEAQQKQVEQKKNIQQIIIVKGSHFHDRDRDVNKLYSFRNPENAELSDTENRQNQLLLSGCELKMWLLQQDLLESKQQLLNLQDKKTQEYQSELEKQISSIKTAQESLLTQMIKNTILGIPGKKKKARGMG